MAGESGGGLALGGISTILSGVAGYQEASANSLQAKWEAKQRKRNARMALAESSREASEIRRKGDLVKSSAVAAMAASGGGQDSERLADIENVTRYNMLAALYEGGQKSITENTQADLTMASAKSKQRVANMGVATSLFEGGSGLYKEWDRHKKNRGGVDNFTKDKSMFQEYKPFAEYK